MSLITLLVILGWISFTTADVMSMDQAISQAKDEVRDAGLLWDDASILVELDMRFTHEQWKQIQEQRGDYSQRRKKRKAYRPVVTRWDDGVVPYTISDGFSMKGKSVIKAAMKEWERVACVKFRPVERENEPSITFVPTGGCSSNIGKTGRSGQSLTLGNGCQFKGIVIHELGHALGFFHEQSRPDRDSFITVHKQNILPDMQFNFDKYSASTIDTYGIPYDYESIMHYGPYYFSRNGRKTITARYSYDTKKLGNRYGLTFHDIHLANKMYKCADTCSNKYTESCGDGFLGKDCKCWCKGSSKEKPLIYCTTGEPIEGDSSTGVKPTKPTRKPITQAPPTDLTDSDHGCQDWAKAGFCSYDPYTIRHCKRSCYYYSKRRMTTAAPDEDQHHHCAYWASIGECRNNPGYMLFYCKRSCGQYVQKCVDAAPKMCQMFRRECNSRNLQKIMRKMCAKTCNSCTRQQMIASCEDLAPRTCSLFAVVGKCISADPKIKKDMQITCPKACGLCDNASDDSCPSGNCGSGGGNSARVKDRNCYDRFPICPKWSKASQGCNAPLLRTTMKIFCRRSCNLC